jgi:hypothetical protein
MLYLGNKSIPTDGRRTAASRSYLGGGSREFVLSDRRCRVSDRISASFDSGAKRHAAACDTGAAALGVGFCPSLAGSARLSSLAWRDCKNFVRSRDKNVDGRLDARDGISKQFLGPPVQRKGRVLIRLGIELDLRSASLSGEDLGKSAYAKWRELGNAN